MRLIDRSTEPIPLPLRDRVAEAYLDRAREHFADPSQEAAQRVFAFEPLYEAPAVVSALDRLFRGCCAFCDSLLLGRSASGPDVHHFRPMQDAVDMADGAERRADPPSRLHYWWLAYEWSNLYLACNSCSRAAGSIFPVSGERLPPETRPEDGSEIPLLVDPCRDNPFDHFAFDLDGFVRPLSVAGELTIQTFSLNRSSLVRPRRIAMNEALLFSRRPGADLGKLIDAPFSSAIAAALAARSKFDLVDFVDRQRKGSLSERGPSAPVTDLPDEKAPAAVRHGGEIARIEIRNFRGIASLDLDFPNREDTSPWMALIGENGNGKSTVLQAIALASMGAGALETFRRSYGDDLSWCVRRGADEATVTVYFVGAQKRTLRIGADGQLRNGPDYDESFPVAAYGAGRIQPFLGDVVSGPIGEDGLRVESLFDPRILLTSASKWASFQHRAYLGEQNQELFPYVARVLSMLVAEEASSIDVDEHGRLNVHLADRPMPVPMEELSDGYRAMMTLAVDLMRFFIYRFGSMELARGVVLIDELEAHLHPRWQMRVVGALRRAFPHLQFVVTTHAPLCLRGLADNEVAVMERSSTDHTIFALTGDELPPLAGLDAAELLTSEVFGLNSTVSPELDDALREYQHLLGKARTADAPARPEQEQVRVDALRETLARHRALGTSARERIALQAVDTYLGAIGDESDREVRVELRADLKLRLQEVWNGQLGPSRRDL